MAELQALVRFAGIPEDRIKGGEFILSRGVTPSSGRIFLEEPPDRLDPAVGSLVFEEGSEQVELRDCALAPHTLRLFRGRDAWVWSVQVVDRRWRWRYPRISGQYNLRDCEGQIVAASRRTLEELLNLLLDALGESRRRLVGIPAQIYPEVRWDSQRADLELARLCEQHGLVPFLGTDNEVAIEVLGSGRGIEASPHDKIPQWRYGQAVLPSSIEVRGGPTVHQQAIALVPVGLDADGIVKPIEQLSYRPAGGWGSCWYTTFSAVPIQHRHLAFQSVWRWYEPVLASVSVGAQLTDLRQLILYDTVAESPARQDGVVRCAPPQIRGVFWPQTDHPRNTGAGTHYSGEFEIDAVNRLVKFPTPVIALQDGVIQQPTLELVTAFSVADDAGIPRPSASRRVPGGTGPDRIELREYLRPIDRRVPLYGALAEATSQQNELAAIADALAAGHQGTYAMESWLDGIRKVNLTGRIAQIRWSCGVQVSMAPTTRLSENFEFSEFVPHWQERRRRERGNQVADRVLR